MSDKSSPPRSRTLFRLLSFNCCARSASTSSVQPVTHDARVVEVKSNSRSLESHPMVHIDFLFSEAKRNSANAGVSESAKSVASDKSAEELRMPSDLSQRSSGRPELRKAKSKKSMVLRGNRHKSIFANDINEFEVTL